MLGIPPLTTGSRSVETCKASPFLQVYSTFLFSFLLFSFFETANSTFSLSFVLSVFFKCRRKIFSQNGTTETILYSIILYSERRGRRSTIGIEDTTSGVPPAVLQLTFYSDKNRKKGEKRTLESCVAVKTMLNNWTASLARASLDIFPGM